MKNKTKRNRLIYFTMFCFFLLILFLSPISGDDWGNFLEGEQGLRHIFGQAVGMYFSWEGRFISRILINILTYHKWLWNIINSLVIITIIWEINKAVKPTNKKVAVLLSVLTLLLMNIYTFSQVITWIAGNITYLFPLAIILVYTNYIRSNFSKEIPVNHKIILLLTNIFLPMFVEHMAGLLLMINISVIVIKYIINKKIDIEWLIYTIICLLSTLLMFFSPGTILRNATENLEFNKLNIFSKVFYNLPNFIYYTFIVNSFLLIILSINHTYYLLKTKLNKTLKILLILYMTIIPILTIIIYNLSQFIIVPNYLLNFIDSNSIFIILYWIIYIIIYLLFLLINTNSESGKWNLIYTMLGLLSNGIMLLSPTWGYRTSLATYIFLMIPAIKLFSDIKISKIIEKIIIIITIISSLIWFIFYINIRLEQTNLEKSITKQLKDNKEVIEISSFPSYANCNINPLNSYHLEKFKEFYSIPKNKEVVLLPNNWRYLIIK